MQGSAADTQTAVIYEVSGLISEWLTVEGLLKGLTPVRATEDKLKAKAAWMKSKVQPEPEHEPTEMSAPEAATEEDKRVEARAESRVRFCVGALLMLNISEATSICISSMFWVVLRLNASAPGARPLPKAQIAINTFIMVFGEVVITDGAIAWLSSTYKKYKVDVTKEWAWEKKKYPVFWFFVMVSAAFTPLVFIADAPLEFCITSETLDVRLEDWSLSTCPAFPLNISHVERLGVGEEFLHLLP